MTFDYGRFYTLGEGFEPRAFRVNLEGEAVDPLALTRAEVVPEKPVRFRRDEGARLLDFIGTTEAILRIVSDRVIAAFRDASFTGWTTYPIEIREWTDERVPGYQGLAVSGRSGPIDDALSPIEVLPPPVPRGAAMPHHIGLFFHPETWDGSDIFTPEGSALLIMTQPVRDTLLSLGATNLDLARQTDVVRLVLDEEGEVE